MKNIKILGIVTMLIFAFTCLIGNVNANEMGIIDIYSADESYSLSEETNNIYLPFIRFSKNNIIVDKEVDKTGLIFCRGSLDVKSNINKSVALMASDSIRLNAELKNGFIFSSTTIVIDSNINGDLILCGMSGITISENANINGDIICYTPNLNIKGNVNGSVIGIANSVEVTGNIQKDFRMQLNNISVKDENRIAGEVYIESYNLLSEIKIMYPDMNYKVLKSKQTNLQDEIYNGIYLCIIFVLIYLIISKISKNKFFETQLEKVINNKSKVVMIGALGIALMPVVILVSLLLLLIGVYVIAIPLLVIYFGIFAISACISIFIIGMLLVTYIKNTYIKNNSIIYEILSAILIFAILYCFGKIPTVSSYIGIIYIILAFGIICTCVIKRIDNNKKGNIKK